MGNSNFEIPGILHHDWPDANPVARLRRSDLNLRPDEEERKSLFWHLLCTEADSQNFFKFLTMRSDSWSPGFREFMKYWIRDEKIHAEAYADLYALIFGSSRQAVMKEVYSRPVDFRSISHLLKDEFSICLLLAYDELITSTTYARSVPFYEQINKPVLGRWIRQLSADESIHFGNLIYVLKNHHKDRLHEAPGVLAEVVEFEKTSTSAYGATFVMDHSTPDFWGSFTDAEIDGIKSTIMNKLSLPEETKLFMAA